MQVNCTMFMALLSAFNVLLAHYSNEESVVCGLPYAGRNRAETEGTLSTLTPERCTGTDSILACPHNPGGL